MKKISEEIKIIFVSIFLIIGMSLQFQSNSGIKGYLQSGNYLTEIVSLLSTIILVIVYRGIKAKSNEIKNRYFIIIMSIFLACTIVIGRVINNFHSISILTSFEGIIFVMWSIIAFTIFLYTMISYLYLKIFYVGSIEKSNIKTSNNLMVYFLGLFILLCTWLCYAIIFHPGIWGWDGMDQINQFYAVKSHSISFYLTNHHPYLTTVIMGSVFDFWWKLTSNSNICVFFIILLNLILMGNSVVYLSFKIRKIISNEAGFWVYIFITFFPIFPMWAITVDKTCYFLTSYMAFMGSLLSCWSNLINNRKIVFIDYLLLFLFGVLVGLTRNDGLLYIIASLIGIICIHANNKAFKRGIVLALTFSACFILFFNIVLLPIFKVLPTEPAETMAVPLQQIARVAKFNPSGISDKQKKELSRFLNYSNLKKVYTPDSYDSVKYTVKFPMWKFKGNYESRIQQFRNVTINKFKMNFYELWLNIGKRNIGIYMDALLDGHMGFIYPVDNGISTFILNDKPLNGGASKYEYTKYEKNYKYSHLKIKDEVYNGILHKGILNRLLTSSFFVVLVNCSTWFWAAAIIVTILLARNINKNLIWFFHFAVIVMIAFMGPINYGLRYVFPYLILVPILICILIYERHHMICNEG